MDATNHKQKLIEKYFSGTLSAEEQAQLQEELKDPAFRQAFEFERRVEQSLDDEISNHPLKKFLEEAEKKSNEKKIEASDPIVPVDERRPGPALTIPLSIPMWWVGAAATALLLIVMVVLNPFASGPSPRLVLQEAPFFLDPSFDENLSDANRNSLATCRKKYREAKNPTGRKAAIDCFQSLETGEEAATILLYLGNLHFLDEDYPAALRSYETVLDREGLPAETRDLANWQKMLTLYLLDDPAYRSLKTDFQQNNPNSAFRNRLTDLKAKLPDF